MNTYPACYSLTYAVTLEDLNPVPFTTTIDTTTDPDNPTLDIEITYEDGLAEVAYNLRVTTTSKHLGNGGETDHIDNFTVEVDCPGPWDYKKEASYLSSYSYDVAGGLQ